MKLTMYGWVEGMQKVELTKTLRREFGYGLAEAKQMTDQVLDEIAVSIGGLEGERAERLAAVIRGLGVKVRVEAE